MRGLAANPEDRSAAFCDHEINVLAPNRYGGRQYRFRLRANTSLPPRLTVTDDTTV